MTGSKDSTRGMSLWPPSLYKSSGCVAWAVRLYA